MRATHGTDAVGVTNRPVASPARDWSTEIQSAATCLPLPTAKSPDHARREKDTGIAGHPAADFSQLRLKQGVTQGINSPGTHLVTK